MEGRVPSRPAVSAAAPLVEMELDLPKKTEPLAEPGTTGICGPPAPRCLLYGGPGSIPASSVSGSSAGRDGTRPSTKSQSHRRSQEQPASTAHQHHAVCFMEGRVPSRPAVLAATPLVEMELDLPKKARATSGARNNQHLPPTSTTLSALWRAGFHPGQRCQRRLRWSRWNSTFQKYRAAGGARNNQHLPPTSTTQAALWRAGFHPGQRCRRNHV
ncbi:hypothetical protein LCGC14_0323750 [marine sediment metagenome]|uniref:Uncharacterized protein n=1 Tax=marine sediment metagenome TaxID=412755 RepID=A0A0F9TNV9_9ZZZZ